LVSALKTKFAYIWQVIPLRIGNRTFRPQFRHRHCHRNRFRRQPLIKIFEIGSVLNTSNKRKFFRFTASYIWNLRPVRMQRLVVKSAKVVYWIKTSCNTTRMFLPKPSSKSSTTI